MIVDVSVVVPCFDCEGTIRRSFESIMNQTKLPKEVIFVNDCSGDSTLDVLLGIQTEYENSSVEIIILDLSFNSGPATARNIGWNKASSSYVAFLDSDDSWHHQKLAVQYNFMLESGAELTGHHVDIMTSSSIESTEYIVDSFKAKKITFNKLLFKNYFPTPTVMIKRNVSSRFPEGAYFAEDYELWLDVTFNKPSFLIPISLCFLHKPAFGSSGLSSKMIEMEKGVHSVFRRLYNKNYISRTKWILVVSFSYIKYLRRLFISKTMK
ncbi:glycosyltransferase family 2 protein [Shewanella sp. BJSY2023SW001]|uniref:glycosyltransferase family 2 protein n=1 Tax=Shewanella sp. BJSY2023SW001 TaxID=3392039 RepID=UPI0039B43DED